MTLGQDLLVICSTLKLRKEVKIIMSAVPVPPISAYVVVVVSF
jgi:hypothetical protein